MIHIVDHVVIQDAHLRPLLDFLRDTRVNIPRARRQKQRKGQHEERQKLPQKFCHLFPPQSRIALAIVAALTAAAFMASASAPVTLTFFVTFAS